MNLNVISDLHCLPSDEENEFGFHNKWYTFKPEQLEPADYLIVAGDMGLFENHVDVIKELRIRTKGKFKDVLWILGNHDYWVNENERWFNYRDEDLTTPCKNHTIDVVDGDVAIIGTTLWTNRTSEAARMRMNDFRNIPEWTSEIQMNRCREETEWLRSKYQQYVQEEKKIVIVTHHNPRTPTEMPEYSRDHDDVAASYWMFDGVLNDIKPAVWICGHIHEELETEIDGVRFVRHPIGYRWGLYGRFPQTNAEGWYNKIVEV